jgi:hypothetical protein
VVLDPHKSMGCAQGQATMEGLVKGMEAVRSVQTDAASESPQGSASTSNSNGAAPGAQTASPEQLKALWLQVSQQRAEAAARARARAERMTTRDKGFSRWLPFFGFHSQPMGRHQQGHRRLLVQAGQGSLAVEGMPTMEWEEDKVPTLHDLHLQTMQVQGRHQGSHRALMAEPDPGDQIAAAAAVWRAYYHASLTQWQHLPKGINNATQVQPGMFPNNRNDSCVFAWPEKTCTNKVRMLRWIVLIHHIAIWAHVPERCLLFVALSLFLLCSLPYCSWHVLLMSKTSKTHELDLCQCHTILFRPCPACSMTTMACPYPCTQ